MLKIISIRQNPEYLNRGIAYFQSRWKNVWPIIYEDCITHAISSTHPLPQWYLLLKDGNIIGGAGLITNDFISRMDLYPWLCALYIDEKHRGNNFAALLIDHAKLEAKSLGFKTLNLCTDHVEYYEKLGFNCIGEGYHP